MSCDTARSFSPSDPQRMDRPHSGESIETTRFPRCLGSPLSADRSTGERRQKSRRQDVPGQTGGQTGGQISGQAGGQSGTQKARCASRRPGRTDTAAGQRNAQRHQPARRARQVANLRHPLDDRVRQGQRQSPDLAAARPVQGHPVGTLAGPQLARQLRKRRNLPRPGRRYGSLLRRLE